MHVKNARKFVIFLCYEQYYEHDRGWRPNKGKFRKRELHNQEGDNAKKHSDSVTDIHSAQEVTRLAIEFVITHLAFIFHFRHSEKSSLLEYVTLPTFRTFFSEYPNDKVSRFFVFYTHDTKVKRTWHVKRDLSHTSSLQSSYFAIFSRENL